jgi:hypothetical protein
MNHSSRRPVSVLAVDPASRGLGYALLDGPDRLIDWGFRNARERKDAQSIAYLKALMINYTPDILVVEAFDPDKNFHRSPRVRNLLNVFASMAPKYGARCERVSRVAVRDVFTCNNKYRIATKLARAFPETKPSCPPERKIWLAEDPRINIFDALALGCTYYAVAEESRRKPNT